jgi:hypothetical protein
MGSLHASAVPMWGMLVKRKRTVPIYWNSRKRRAFGAGQRSFPAIG